jgi:hypothetical protein
VQHQAELQLRDKVMLVVLEEMLALVVVALVVLGVILLGLMEALVVQEQLLQLLALP